MKDLVKRRQKVSWEKLCFKCLKSGHCTVYGLSHACFKCIRKHYISVCINNQLQNNSSKIYQDPKETTLVSLGEKDACWSIVTFYANKIKCKAIVSEHGCSKKLTTLINHISGSPVQQEVRQIEMLLHTIFKKTERTYFYQYQIQSTRHWFNLRVISEEYSLLIVMPRQKYQSILFLEQAKSKNKDQHAR